MRGHPLDNCGFGDRQQTIHQSSEGLIFLRRTGHVLSMIALLALAPVCLLAQSRQNAPHSNTTTQAANGQQSAPGPPTGTLQTQPTTNAANPNPANNPSKQGSKLFRWGAVEWSAVAQAISAVLVTVFTGFLVWYSHRGWTIAKDAANASRIAADAAMETAKASRNATYLQLRARLGLQGITTMAMGPGKEILLVLPVQNFGGKGAFIKDQYIKLTIDPLPSEPNYPDEDFTTVGVPVEAGDSHHLTITIHHFTTDEWQKIGDEDGTTRFRIYGMIRYNAGFGKIARLGFCREYDPRLSRLSGKPIFPTTTIQGYNYAE